VKPPGKYLGGFMYFGGLQFYNPHPKANLYKFFENKLKKKLIKFYPHFFL
jgi:hypothetical protein